MKKIKSIIKKLPQESNRDYGLFLEYASLEHAKRLDEIKVLCRKFGITNTEFKKIEKKNSWDTRLSDLDTEMFIQSFKSRSDSFKEAQATVHRKIVESQAKLLELVPKLTGVAEKILSDASMANEVFETGFFIDENGVERATKTEIKMNVKLTDATTALKTALSIAKDVSSLSPTPPVPPKEDSMDEVIILDNDVDLSKMTEDEVAKLLEETNKHIQ